MQDQHEARGEHEARVMREEKGAKKKSYVHDIFVLSSRVIRACLRSPEKSKQIRLFWRLPI